MTNYKCLSMYLIVYPPPLPSIEISLHTVAGLLASRYTLLSCEKYGQEYEPEHAKTLSGIEILIPNLQCLVRYM